MSELVFAPQPLVSVAVAGQGQRFPVARVFCLGRNYWWPDALAAGRPERETPFFFMKPAAAAIAAEGELQYPPMTAEFCPEIELVIAIGKDAVNLTVEAALDAVWGYAAGLDMTRRDLQMAAREVGRPWEGAKAFDASAPLSPIVPVSRIGHPNSGALWLTVNGVERQRSDLANQIWSVAELLSHFSHSLHLRAGDLIFTGTPAGVEGVQPGDQVLAGIEGIGEISVRIAPAAKVSTQPPRY